MSRDPRLDPLPGDQAGFRDRPDKLFLSAAVDLVGLSLIRGDLTWCGFCGGGDAISSSYGGYVADPPVWDQVRPLRKLKPNEVATYDRERVVYFTLDQVRAEVDSIIARYPKRLPRQ